MTLKQSHDLKQSSEFIKVKSLVGAECGESRTLRSSGGKEEMPDLPNPQVCAKENIPCIQTDP